MKYQIQARLKSGDGSIVNISSILGSVGFAGYSAAKHGVFGLTQTATLEYAGQGVHIFAIGPGFIDTHLLDALDDEMEKQLVALHPIGHRGKSEEIAEFILWLST